MSHIRLTHQDIDCIGLDADDTLWQNFIFYQRAEREFADIMKNYVSADSLMAAFEQTETRNMPVLGYGCKATALSMIETALNLVPDIPAKCIKDISDAGRRLMTVPIELLDGVRESIDEMQKRGFRIAIITKGEFNEQARKFSLSGLDQTIPYRILPDKEPQTYLKLLQRDNIDPTRFLMVGNSPRSDILPPLSIGSWAAHVPFRETWSHENVPIENHPRLIRLNTFREILDYIE